MAKRQLIAGVDSSIQSTNVVMGVSSTVGIVQQGGFSHLDGDELHSVHRSNGLYVAPAKEGGIN